MSQSNRLKFIRDLFLGAIVVPLVSTSCGITRTVVITADPPESRVTVNGIEQGGTPYSARLHWGERDHHRVIISQEDYESEMRDLTYKSALSARDPWELDIKLQPLVATMPVRITTEPEGATIKVNDRDCGSSPLSTSVRFERSSADSAWGTATFEAKLNNFMPQYQTLTKNEVKGGQINISLVEVRRELPARISCNIDDAEVRIDGVAVGRIPLERVFVFERADASKPWPIFQIDVSKPDFFWREKGGPIPATDYAPYTAVLSIEKVDEGLVRAELEPFRFRWTRLAIWDFGPDGPYIHHELVLSQVDEIDTEPMVKAATRITDVQPGHLAMTRLSSPTSGADVVYSIPFECEKIENLCTNVWRQIGQGVTRLTDSATAAGGLDARNRTRTRRRRTAPIQTDAQSQRGPS